MQRASQGAFPSLACALLGLRFHCLDRNFQNPPFYSDTCATSVAQVCQCHYSLSSVEMEVA